MINPAIEQHHFDFINRYPKWPKVIGLVVIVLLISWLGYRVIQWQAFKDSQSVRPSPSPSPTVTPTITPTISPTSSPSPTLPLSPTPTATPTPTSQPTAVTPVPTAIALQPEIVWGNRTKKQVIFTFDAGSGNQSIGAILDTLDQYQVEGTFFITGDWANKYPLDLARIASRGHGIYNHTYTHPHLTQLTDTEIKNQLKNTDAKIIAIAGYDSKPFFRAPYGERDNRVLSVAASQGYRHVYWTIDALDWKVGVTAQQVKDRILENVQPGTIYLMHVGDAITGQILGQMFQEIINRGYSIVSLRLGIL